MAYITGFFAADGYITINKRGAHFWSIQITDKDLLYSIKDCVGAEHLVSKRIGNRNNKNQYRLQIGSFEMCNDLRKLGFRENKTKSLTVPHVPKKYFSSFVRGYFDGDGHVWAGLMNKKRVVPTKAIITVFTSCSLIFLKKLQRRLAESGINGGVIRTADKNYSRLTYSIKSSLKLYDFMYNKSVLEKTSLFLKRKKIVFEKYKKLRQVSYCDRSSVG